MISGDLDRDLLSLALRCGLGFFFFRLRDRSRGFSLFSVFRTAPSTGF
jgi:hypothetical protein